MRKTPSSKRNSRRIIRSPRNFSRENRPRSKRVNNSLPYRIKTPVKTRRLKIYDLSSSRSSSRASSVSSNRSSVGIQVSIPLKF